MRLNAERNFDMCKEKNALDAVMDVFSTSQEAEQYPEAAGSALLKIIDHFLVCRPGLTEGIEMLYTKGIVDYKLRSKFYAAGSCEEKPQQSLCDICGWFMDKVGVSAEQLEEHKASVAAYAERMYELGALEKSKGHKIAAKTYFELAADKGHEAAAALLDEEAEVAEYMKTMYKLGLAEERKGHNICAGTYFELAAAKGCPYAAEKLAERKEYAMRMHALGEAEAAKGHKIAAKTYFELAAAKGCPVSKAKLAEL